jgi:hypothetical protein
VTYQSGTGTCTLQFIIPAPKVFIHSDKTSLVRNQMHDNYTFRQSSLKKYKIFIKKWEIYYLRTTTWQLILWKANSSEEKKITFIIDQNSFWEIDKTVLKRRKSFSSLVNTLFSEKLIRLHNLQVESTTMNKHQTYQHHKVQTASDLYVLNLSSSFLPIARLSLILNEFCHQTKVGWQI